MTSSLEEHYHSWESEETAEVSLLFLFCSNMLNDASTRNRSAEKLETEVNSIRHSMLRKHAAIMFQQRWVWRPKALGLTSKSIGFDVQKHWVWSEKAWGLSSNGIEAATHPARDHFSSHHMECGRRTVAKTKKRVQVYTNPRSPHLLYN